MKKESQILSNELLIEKKKCIHLESDREKLQSINEMPKQLIPANPKPANDIIIKLHMKIKQMVDCIMELLEKDKLSFALKNYHKISEQLKMLDMNLVPLNENIKEGNPNNKENKKHKYICNFYYKIVLRERRSNTGIKSIFLSNFKDNS